MAMVFSLPASSLAVDGRVDVRGNQQGGRAGALSYTTENMWEDYSLDQRVKLAHSSLFQVRYSFRRENLWSRTGLGSSESQRNSHTPFAALTYRGRSIRAGMSATALRKDSYVAGVDDRRDENITGTGWLWYEVGRAELSLRYQDATSERRQGPEYDKTRNSVAGFNARFDASSNDRFRYSLSHTRNKQITLGNRTTYLSNILEYYGNHRFADDRGRLNVATTAGRFDQRNTYDAEGPRAYLSPIWGGMLLDDTPENQDPLEPDPVPEPLLYDNDVETPTLVNIGDSAPAVREFGGDYRNVILDFGHPVAFDSMALHVSAPIDFPGLIQWQVYVTNDPEGRDWGVALTPGAVTVTYREWETGRQGWQVVFTNPVTERRVKLVDTKLGVTEPNIFVTELEVFSPPDAREREVSSTLNRYRVYGEVRYDVRPRLEINYSIDAYEHRRNDNERTLSGAVHQAGSIWRPGPWEVSGYYQISSLSSASQSENNAHAQFLSVAKRFTPKVDSRVSWKRIDDNSPALEYTTNDLNLDVNWRFAPGLYFNQKVGHGRRSDHQTARLARSWVVLSSIRSTPVRTLSVNLTQVERWVDQDAGNGFTAFSNTELVTRWSILPLLAYDNQLIYRRREGSDWSARQQLSWTPLPGGNLGMTFNAIDYRDTRVDLKQKSVGAHFDWRVRSNTRMEFGAEYVNIAQHGARNTPHNVYARGSLNF